MLDKEQAAKGSNSGDANSKLKAGDVVIIKDDAIQRAFWRLAKVETLLPGRDGIVRAAIVTVQRGTNLSQSTQRLRRPLRQLIPIEVDQ